MSARWVLDSAVKFVQYVKFHSSEQLLMRSVIPAVTTLPKTLTRSMTEQFHRRCRNWCWHSSIASCAPCCTPPMFSAFRRQTRRWRRVSPARRRQSTSVTEPATSFDEMALDCRCTGCRLAVDSVANDLRQYGEQLASPSIESVIKKSMLHHRWRRPFIKLSSAVSNNCAVKDDNIFTSQFGLTLAELDLLMIGFCFLHFHFTDYPR